MSYSIPARKPGRRSVPDNRFLSVVDLVLIRIDAELRQHERSKAIVALADKTQLLVTPNRLDL